jgi:hypothetical protein
MLHLMHPMGPRQMRGLRGLHLLTCPNFQDLLLPGGPSRDIPYHYLSVLLYPDAEECTPLCVADTAGGCRYDAFSTDGS